MRNLLKHFFEEMTKLKIPSKINPPLKAYYEKFEETCQKFDVKGPWNDFEDFKQPAISQGIVYILGQ